MIRPENNFYLFGMGNREKYIYKCGELIRIRDGKTVYKKDVVNEEFIYDRYTVILTLANGEKETIKEDEDGLSVGKERMQYPHINLPDFEEYKYPAQMRILHHEILICIKDGVPLPNIFVYGKPWLRDGAMMGMVLKATDNLDIIKDWILEIDYMYDRNNKGNEEPDNLGQLLFLISLVSDKNNPMVEKIVAEAKRITKNGVLTGMTDYGHHEIYATLWLKYSLKLLGLDTDFIHIPEEFDNYARMFWMDRSEVERKTPYENAYNEDYPYLWWAVKHFENEKPDEKYLEIRYPMSWERNASEAKYEGNKILSENYVKNLLGAPHSWHASEMMLYLIEMRK